MDHVIEDIVNRLGDLECAYLIDDYADGKDSGIIDLLLVGDIDQYHLNDLSKEELDIFQLAINSATVQDILDEAKGAAKDVAGLIISLISKEYITKV